MTKTVRVPLPKLGSGYRVIRGMDGKMTSVPLTSSDVANYRPLLAMDAGIGGSKGSPNYASYNKDEAGPPPREDLSKAAWGSGDDDPDDINPAAPDTEEKVRQLLEGKLDPADLDALCNLIFSDDTDTASMPAAPAPAGQDRGRRRQAADRMPSKATVDRLLAEGAARRADRVIRDRAALVKRFPALASARVA